MNEIYCIFGDVSSGLFSLNGSLYVEYWYWNWVEKDLYI